MSWKKVKLGGILKRRKCVEKILGDCDYKLVTIKLHHKGVILRRIAKGSELGSTMSSVKDGDFVLSGIDARNGAFGIVPKELDGAVVTNDFWCLEPDEEIIDKEFLLYLTSTEFFDHICKQSSDGTTQRIRLQKDKFFNYEIHLPRLDEQKEILVKLKEIGSAKEQLNTELNHQLETVKKLRQAFLREAMQGKLIEQNPNDESASELLKKIKAEKEKLIIERIIKQGKIQEAEMQEELLFEIPKNWIWCTLDEISKNITDGTHQTPTYTKEGRIFLSAQNIKPFKFMPENHKFVSEEAYQNIIKSRKPEKGDILIARVGAGIGEAAVINQEIDFCFYVSLGLVQPFKNLLNTEYLTLVINSPYGVKYAKGNISSKGGSAGNLNLGRIRSFLIPLPPLAEQERIVNKLEKLMSFCDELEKSIKQSKEQNEKLLQQVLREALSPSLLEAN